MDLTAEFWAKIIGESKAKYGVGAALVEQEHNRLMREERISALLDAANIVDDAADAPEAARRIRAQACRLKALEKEPGAQKP